MAKSLASARQTTLVVVETDAGVSGIGEAWGMPAINLAYLPLLKDYLVGAHVADVELVFTRIIARHYHFGVQNQLMGSISGIDMAAKDALGQVVGLPVCQLIGGRGSETVPVYASGGYITDNSDEDFAPQIEAMAAAGHKAVKIKIGLGPDSDEARVRTARHILGEKVDIMVDINSNYTLDLAKASIARLAPYRIAWVEEPLTPQDIDGYEILQRASPVPIATGEALYTIFDFKRLSDRHAVDVLQPDLSLCGGFWQGRRIADLGEANHLRLSPHVWGSGIGLAAGVHYVASRSPYPHGQNAPWPTLVEYDVGENPLRESILTEPLVAVDGGLAVPTAPGLGVSLNWDAVNRFTQ
ncbi:MAG: mandelate racemase/muconate lactonizing enzyme family protein [Chelatococcus sp.]|nr:mandelate racemase/muconate lactonizing enzyme family protein [Chelatococcus sp. YT9]MBX3555551.1 mandelate racemase/muconate lactonizing enzyme family protein [Chelatococcus sp.]